VIRAGDGRSHQCNTVGAVFTIKQVGDACGLPHPVIAQLVARTWTEAGWMYTAAQMRAAVALAERLRRSCDAECAQPQRDPISVLACSRCGTVTGVSTTDARRWLAVATADTAATLSCDYCPDCVIACPTCRSASIASTACRQCLGTGRVPRPGLEAN
jgi:hypothetical protein